MRHHHYTVTQSDVHAYACHHLTKYLKLKDYSRKCTVEVLLTTLFAAAACISSIFRICRQLLRAPSDETIRKALLASLPEYAELERRVNRALTGDLPKCLRRKRQRIAIDVHLIPYHGLPYQSEQEIYHSKPRDGTSKFHGYATAYVVFHGHRYTVALTQVTKNEKMAEVVKRLMRMAARAGVRPRLLLLDGGFYNVPVIRYLQRARIPFLTPAFFRGRKPKNPDPTRAPFRFWKKSGWSTYTLTNPKQGRATVSICVVCRNYRGKWKRKGRQRLLYAFWGFQPRSFEWVYQTYRKRFGIETSYRQLNQSRIRTTTRKPLIRFFLVALALLLRNIWVWLHWHTLAMPRRGRRLLVLERMRLATMLFWMHQWAQQAFGACIQIDTERPMPAIT